MALKSVITVLDLLDDGAASGHRIVDLFAEFSHVTARTSTVTGEKGSTDFVRIEIPGSRGKSKNGSAATTGIVGRLGGIGARPARIGFVSDGDGAAAAISTAYKLAEMSMRGDQLPGDVIVTTHVCPNAPTLPHVPVEFMDSPVDILTMNEHEVAAESDVILSIDTTKGNRVVNHRGVAISAPVKQGYILKYSDDLLRILETVSGQPAQVLPLSTQDITPYGNGVHHINSILQPAVATTAPVVGVAITAQSAVPGSATGASHEIDIALATRFAIEVAKEVGAGTCEIVDEFEFDRLVSLYGSMDHLSTRPQESEER